MAMCNAEVPLLKATQCSAPMNLAKFFKLDNIRPETERAKVEVARDGGVKLLAEATELRRQVEVGNFVSHLSGENNRSEEI